MSMPREKHLAPAVWSCCVRAPSYCALARVVDGTNARRVSLGATRLQTSPQNYRREESRQERLHAIVPTASQGNRASFMDSQAMISTASATSTIAIICSID